MKMVPSNGEKTALYKTLFVMVSIVLALVGTLYAFQANRITDHEERVRIVEKCTIEMMKDVKYIREAIDGCKYK